MMTADTLKLSEIATLTILKAQEELEIKSEVDISIPMGYVTKNNILATIWSRCKNKNASNRAYYY